MSVSIVKCHGMKLKCHDNVKKECHDMLSDCLASWLGYRQIVILHNIIDKQFNNDRKWE